MDEETAMKLNRIMLNVEQIGYLISGKQSLLDQVIALLLRPFQLDLQLT